jgi:hypothetical protein
MRVAVGGGSPDCGKIQPYEPGIRFPGGEPGGRPRAQPTMPAARFPRSPWNASAPWVDCFCRRGRRAPRIVGHGLEQLFSAHGPGLGVRKNLVIKTGYGVFFEVMGADRNDVHQQGFSQRTSLVPSLDNGLTFRATLANPFPDGLLEPKGAAGGLATYVGRSPGILHAHAAARLHAALESGNAAGIPPPGLARGRLRRQPGYRAGRQRRLRRGSGRVPESLARSRSAGHRPSFPGGQQPVLRTARVRGQQPDGSNSGPIAALASVSALHRHHFDNQLRLLVVPLASGAGRKTLLARLHDTSQLHLVQVHGGDRETESDRSPPAPRDLAAGSPAPHCGQRHLRVSFRAGQAIPVAGRLGQRVVGGWSVQGIYNGQSGPPLGWGNILFYGNIKEITLPKSERRVERWFNTEAGFERDTRKQLAWNIRTFPLRFNDIRQDGYNNWDLSLFKTIRIKERVSFQLRAEAQDAFNHPCSRPQYDSHEHAFRAGELNRRHRTEARASGRQAELVVMA